MVVRALAWSFFGQLGRGQIPYSPSFSRVRRLLMILVPAVLLICGIALALNYYSFHSHVTVGVVEVAVYSDSGGFNPLVTLEWGLVTKGTNETFTVYVRNEGNVNVTISFSSFNYSPDGAQNFIDLYWNYNDLPLTPDEIRPVTFMLSLASSTPYVEVDFDMTIDGTGV